MQIMRIQFDTMQAHSTEAQLKAQLSSGEVMVDNLTAELGASKSHCESLKEDLATIRAQLVAAENEAKINQQEVGQSQTRQDFLVSLNSSSDLASPILPRLAGL